jgi:hypothetical protein
MCFIRDECLSHKKGSYEAKFQALAEHPDLLNKWKIAKKLFINIYQKCMQKLNENAHSFFDTKENFVLNEADLEREELKFIGFLWCVVPLYLRKCNKKIIHLIISFMCLATNCVTNIDQSKRENKK